MKNHPKKYYAAWLAGFYHKQPNKYERLQLEVQYGCTIKVTHSPYWLHRNASTKYLLWRSEKQEYETRELAKQALRNLSKEKLYRVFATGADNTGAKP